MGDYLPQWPRLQQYVHVEVAPLHWLLCHILCCRSLDGAKLGWREGTETQRLVFGVPRSLEAMAIWSCALIKVL